MIIATIVCAADDDGEDALDGEEADIPQHRALELVERVDEHKRIIAVVLAVPVPYRVRVAVRCAISV